MVTQTYGSWNSLFNDPFFIGFDKLVNKLTYTPNQQVGFPPYNVRKEDEDTFVVELAVAGFSKEELRIKEHDGDLIVEGSKLEDDKAEYVHKGIAGRKFTRNFLLGEYMNIKSADLNDGMLYITVKREIPEDKLPKQIPIN
jgi:molecular chaperone IbpA